MPYLIQRLDQGGGYLAPPGSVKSYTKRPDRARVFETRAEAEAELCPGNERVVSAPGPCDC